MSDLVLTLGNKNYSSWSMRAWLALRQAGIPFEETVVPLFTPEWEAAAADEPWVIEHCDVE